MKKADIETRDGQPAVNVKVYGSLHRLDLPLNLGRVSDDGGKTWTDVLTEPAFDHDYIEKYATEEDFSFACEMGWEYLQGEATEIFGKGVKVYSEGRSGGWAVVHGLDPIEDWDAIAVSKWSRFVKIAEATAEDIPRQMAEMVYHNEFALDSYVS